MATAHTSAKLKFVLLTCLLPILATKGSRVLEEKVNETEVLTSETISDSAECYAGLLVHFESSPACI